MKLIFAGTGHDVVTTDHHQEWYEIGCLACPRGPWLIYGPRGERFACSVCGELLEVLDGRTNND